MIRWFALSVLASPPNKTVHHTRKVNKDGAYNDQKPSYRSFQPVFKHKTIYPRHDDRDYDITSYDTEYGGVVSNFTSSIYDDNPQLYPNPEFVARNTLGLLLLNLLFLDPSSFIVSLVYFWSPCVCSVTRLR